ncbi:hypothetical protein [Halopseudomonas pelagia]|uniref:hypothetical protein n=1 Tax=Halopseudomonas pelagia TaxID=553151 RepID=UPI000399DAB0|nr:hypothetical protein [Halopseudomonas pelagia]
MRRSRLSRPALRGRRDNHLSCFALTSRESRFTSVQGQGGFTKGLITGLIESAIAAMKKLGQLS